MTAYIVRRLFATLPVMGVVAICVFLLLHLSPGDPAAVIAGDNATAENIAMIRQRLGLDEPLWKQFLLWIGQLLRGDLGQSMFWRTPVVTLIGQRYEPTLSLALTTLIVAVSIAVTLGVVAAWRAATFVDRAVMGFAVLGFSVPVFVVGYVLIYVFAIQLKWAPVQGYAPISEELDDGRIGLVWAEAEAYADPPDKIAEMMKGKKRERYLDEEAVRFNVLDRLRGAQKDVVLTSPYLIPGAKGIELMQGLRERGVKVRLLTNSLAATDEPLVHIGYSRYRKQMLRLGVELYELSPTRVKRNWKLGMFGTSHGRLHAKTAVIDRRLVFIGSMNFDPRSDVHNTEMGIFIDSPQLARELLRLADLDKLQASYRVRLGADGDTVQWLGLDDEMGEMVLEDEPDAGLWLQIWLNLIAPLAPEELL